MKNGTHVYPVGDPETIGVVVESRGLITKHSSTEQYYIEWFEGSLNDGWYASNSLCQVE